MPVLLEGASKGWGWVFLYLEKTCKFYNQKFRD